MNRKFKTISAAILAAVMCASLAGCANSEKPNSDSAQSRTESSEHIKANNSESQNNSDEASDNPQEPSENEEETFALRDEIKNAGLASGLIQLNNDIFQLGGYQTVEEFVEKYKDKYAITAVGGILGGDGIPYEECKDTLLEYVPDDNGMGGYYLFLTPKNGDSSHSLQASVISDNSKGEAEAPLKKLIVKNVDRHLGYIRLHEIPKWIPKGFLTESHYYNFESENNNYTREDLIKIFEAEGLTKEEGSGDNSYWEDKRNGHINCWILGEKNLLGKRPLYSYSFIFLDDKVSDVQYSIVSIHED